MLAAGVLHVGAQAGLALVAGRNRRTSAESILQHIRFGLGVVFVTVVNGMIGDESFRPAAVLYIPIIALAASISGRQMVIVGAMEAAGYLAPVVYGDPDHVITVIQRGIGLAVTAVVVSIGVRRTVAAMTIAMERLRTARARDRRRSRQIVALEEVGRLLAATGPTSEAMDRVVGLLRVDLGYEFVSLYLGSADSMRLAAHRGYNSVIDTFDGSAGIMGRVMRTKTAAYVSDVSADPDYLSADDAVKSEISAPLLVGDELTGVVNIEAAQTLDRSDLATILLVADRLSSALALARERGRLESRADLFHRLATFSSTVNGTLDADSLYEQIVNAIPTVIQADTVVLTVLDRGSGRYRVMAITGSDQKYVGLEVQPGEGLAGRAIRDRAAVVDGAFSRDKLPARLKDDMQQVMAGIGVPLIRDDVVVGALTLVRDVGRPFESTELEVLPVLAGLTALSVTNTFLHGEVTDASIRDPLTGLFNRRYLDSVVAQMDAVRQRQAPDDRRRTAVVLFDLDRFGSFNKRYGHQTGDAVLRAFADVLRGRLRGADLVARYGGEEFVVFLDGAGLDEAVHVAEEVREQFGATTIASPDGGVVSATVSAGCAAMGADLGTFSEILARADMGLAIAKHAGRNRVVTA